MAALSLNFLAKKFPLHVHPFVFSICLDGFASLFRDFGKKKTPKSAVNTVVAALGRLAFIGIDRRIPEAF